MDAIRAFDVAYFAASTDPPEKNREFAASLDLDYPILSDPTATVAQAFGVLSPDGECAQRWTFYIDREGRFAEVDKKVRPKTHGADVAAKLAELGVARRK